jgi:hypothetical protein
VDDRIHAADCVDLVRDAVDLSGATKIADNDPEARDATSPMLAARSADRACSTT